jgi:hypothetical protein
MWINVINFFVYAGIIVFGLHHDTKTPGELFFSAVFGGACAIWLTYEIENKRIKGRTR